MLLPVYARLSLPALLTAAVTVPRTGRMSEPTKSVDLTVVWLADSLPFGPATGGAVPWTSELVANVKTFPGTSRLRHVYVELGWKNALTLSLSSSPSVRLLAMLSPGPLSSKYGIAAQ